MLRLSEKTPTVTSTAIIRRIQENARRLAGFQYQPSTQVKLRGLVAGKLDEYLGTERRHLLIQQLFDYGDGGSTKHLTSAEIKALLDWLALIRPDPLEGYQKTAATDKALEEMEIILAAVQPPLLESEDVGEPTASTYR